MKGTLYSSDFIKTSQGEFKLLELNTDTDFPSASLEHFNWIPFIDELASSSIDTVHVVYKNFQSHLKTNLSESIASSATGISWEETLETSETIYPTDVQDSTTKFVLRMAYNEAAILDSDYCKNGINLYKLYSDYSASNDIIPHYVSSSNDDYVNDSLDKTTNAPRIPDYVVKKGIFTAESHLNFYKLGSSSLSSEERFNDMIASEYEDGDVISTFYDTSEDGNYVKSYRSCNILYGSELNYINIGTYKISSWLELPTTLEIDDNVLVNKLPNKHRYEFASNWPKEYWKNQTGVSSEAILTPTTGSPEFAKDTVVGKQYLSFDIPGLPDVDDYSTITSWSLDGNTLPEGTSITSSVLVSKQSHSVDYGVLTEISCSDDSSLYIGSALPLLAYDVNEDKIRFEFAHNLLTGSFQLFNSSGSRIDIVENNIAIFENEEFTYELNMESDDTFLVNNSGVFLIAHNPYYAGSTCFLAGAEITTSVGVKLIEDIEVGDVVTVWDETNNKFSYGDVIEIDHRHTVGDHLEGCRYVGYNQPGVFKISIDMGSEEGFNDLGLRFTPEHPFLTKEGWKALAPIPSQEPWATQQTEIKVLEEGDFIKFSNSNEGTWYEIKEIEFEPMSAETKVYNFTVNTFHNYVANSVVVHNK